MYKIRLSLKFQDDLRRIKKMGYDVSLLTDVLKLLSQGTPLPEKYNDRIFIRNYNGFRECRIAPNLFIIYEIDDSELILYLTKIGIIKEKIIANIKYHFVFCSRNKRKIFDIAGVEDRFRELTSNICELYKMDILDLKCSANTVYIYITAPPELSPTKISTIIKTASSRPIKEEFFELEEMTNLWTENFFVTTEKTVDTEVIKAFIANQ